MVHQTGCPLYCDTQRLSTKIRLILIVLQSCHGSECLNIFHLAVHTVSSSAFLARYWPPASGAPDRVMPTCAQSSENFTFEPFVLRRRELAYRPLPPRRGGLLRTHHATLACASVRGRFHHIIQAYAGSGIYSPVGHGDDRRTSVGPLQGCAARVTSKRTYVP